MSERPLYRYEYLHVPFPDALRVLESERDALLQPATDRAVEHADRLQATLVVELAGFEVGREVLIETGAVERVLPGRARLPVAWSASRREGLFPSLRGTLELTELTVEPAVVQLSLASTYRPPLGALGAASDALWGHHLAEAAVHRFLHDVAGRIEAAARAVPDDLHETEPG